MKMATPTPSHTSVKNSSALTRSQAETLALQVLTFLLEDNERIKKFLQLTGVDPDDLPALAPQPRFLLAVLDHLAGDEELLMIFARQLGLNPEVIAFARSAFGGGDAG